MKTVLLTLTLILSSIALAQKDLTFEQLQARMNESEANTLISEAALNSARAFTEGECPRTLPNRSARLGMAIYKTYGQNSWFNEPEKALETWIVAVQSESQGELNFVLVKNSRSSLPVADIVDASGKTRFTLVFSGSGVKCEKL